MSSAEIKLKIFREIDSLEPSKLKELYGIMHNYINSKMEIDQWVGVSESEQSGIEAAITELSAGKGIAHAEVMAKFKSKYPHA